MRLAVVESFCIHAISFILLSLFFCSAIDYFNAMYLEVFVRRTGPVFCCFTSDE